MSVAGIDLALASTGVARLDWPDDGEPSPRTWHIDSEAPANADLAAEVDRMLDIRLRVAAACSGVDLALIEGPAPSRALDKGKFSLWGLWWQVVADLRTSGAAVAQVSTGTLKIYAVGFGGSSKQKVEKADIVRAVRQRYPRFLLPSGAGLSDVADSCVLAAMGARHIGRPIDDLPTTHLRALSSVRWPEPLRRNEIGDPS